ncbi:hypothetical protein D3C71_1742170 [compost metagenome]
MSLDSQVSFPKGFLIKHLQVLLLLDSGCSLIIHQGKITKIRVEDKSRQRIKFDILEETYCYLLDNNYLEEKIDLRYALLSFGLSGTGKEFLNWLNDSVKEQAMKGMGKLKVFN